MLALWTMAIHDLPDRHELDLLRPNQNPDSKELRSKYIL